MKHELLSIRCVQVPIAYPSGLLVRERALIVNLDSIRLIAARDQVSADCMLMHAMSAITGWQSSL